MDNLERASSSSSLRKRINVLRAGSQESRIIVKGRRSTSLNKDWHQTQYVRRPVIKIVHIYNPTVIKTDAANFRALVQKLTGNSTCALTSNVESTDELLSKVPLENNAARPKEIITANKINDHFNFKSPTSTIAPAFPETSHDMSCSLRSNSNDAGGSIHFLRAAKSVYIPERLGTFKDFEAASALVSSLQPLQFQQYRSSEKSKS